MIWHPFVALGCVFMIERIVQEENLLFKCWFRLPYSCMPGMVYVQRAKKTPVIIRHLFTLSHQLNVRQSGAGTATFSLFLPPRPVHALHDRFC